MLDGNGTAKRVAHHQVVAVDLGLDEPREEGLHLGDARKRRAVGAGPARKIDRKSLASGKRVQEAVVDVVIVGRAVNADQSGPAPFLVPERDLASVDLPSRYQSESSSLALASAID